MPGSETIKYGSKEGTAYDAYTSRCSAEAERMQNVHSFGYVGCILACPTVGGIVLKVYIQYTVSQEASSRSNTVQGGSSALHGKPGDRRQVVTR